MGTFCRWLSPAVLLPVALLLLFSIPSLRAATRKHSVFLGSAKTVPYSAEADPSGVRAGETSLAVRPLLVDGFAKAWTTGEMHTVTAHTFVVQQALRVNDDLPGQKKVQWIWQRGPWLLVDRTHGSAKEIRLPDYEAKVSEVVWFRDMAAYCGVKSTGGTLYAVIYRLNVRKPVVARRLGSWSPGKSANPACAPAEWRKQPLSVTFQQSGGAAATYAIYGDFAVLSKPAKNPRRAARPSKLRLPGTPVRAPGQL